MTPQETLSHHHQICSELHTLALDENRHLRLNQCAPDEEHTARKRELLAKLEESVTALQGLPPERDPALKEIIEKARDRTLQIMELNRENEQLLLRSSLKPPETQAPAMPAAMLQTVYGRNK
jgi:hypothetical protein